MGRWSNLLGTVLDSFRIGRRLTLDASGITAPRTLTFPDRAGTIALGDQVAHVDDPASATAADLNTTLIALLDALQAAGVMAGPPPVPMGLTADYPNAVTGTPYSYTPALTGDYVAPVTFSIQSGAIPAGAGWAFDSATGELSNASPATEESATFVVRATDSSAPSPQIADSTSQTVDVSEGGTVGTLGDTGSNGGGNWPTTTNRALLRRIVVAETITLTQFNMRTRPVSPGGGDRFKGLVYAADGADGEPGTLLAVSDPTGPTAGTGGELLTAPASGTITPQTVWIGYVCNGASGGLTETDSGGTETNATIMLNGGETNYASPSNPCGDWPGSPGPYSNLPALWFDYVA